VSFHGLVNLSIRKFTTAGKNSKNQPQNSISISEFVCLQLAQQYFPTYFSNASPYRCPQEVKRNNLLFERGLRRLQQQSGWEIHRRDGWVVS